MLLSLVARCWETIVVCMSRMFAFMSAVVTVQGSVGMFVVYRELLKVVGFISRCEVLCVVYLYSGCDGYCAFCLTCDACNCICFCMGRMLVSSCRCCMFVSCVHPVQALRAAFCITCSLLVLVGDAIGDHMDEAYSGSASWPPYRWPQASPSVSPMLYLWVF